MIKPKQKLRLAFAGTPPFAATQLKALIERSHNIVGVYTQPDRPSGRGKKIQPSAVKTLAKNHNLDVFQPESLKTSDACRDLTALSADV
jgi:methionyl-tRNA formyltransferase